MLALMEFSLAFVINVVSSAYWEILCSCLYRVSPSMFLLDLMASAKISAAMTNRYGDTGSPCLHPLPKVICSEKFPFCRTFDVDPICNDLTQFIVFLPKLKISRVFDRKSHEIESNAFSKSISIINPSMFLLLHSSMISYVNLVFSPMNLPLMNPF